MILRKPLYALFVAFLAAALPTAMTGCNLLPQADADEDGVANADDNCPDDENADQADGDEDEVGDVCDNCPEVANADQADENDDGVGDACEVDAKFARFTDPENPDFTTPDVRDVDEEIVRFDTTDNSIVWAEDGSSYQAGSWEVNGLFLGGPNFQVRFGTKDGQRRAYFTEAGPATICQIEANGVSISISATNVTVPQE
jgi:hypothetical protein